LKYTIDDGDAVEPVHYLPVVPLLAINGSVGIGTGYSTNIPPHNPRHVVALLKQRLQADIESLTGIALDPWWVGFRGGLVRKEDKQWVTKALYEFDDAKSTVKITELPVGCWTKDYKAFLDKMALAEGAECKYEGKPVLRNFEDLYNDVDVNFILYLEKDYYEEAKDNREEFEKRFHLTTSWKTTNMCCFDNNHNITKYDTIGSMLEEFFAHRLVAYEARRAWLIAALKDKIEELAAVRDFVRGVVDGTVKIMNVEDDVVLGSLKKLGLPPRSDREAPDTLKAYEYLLRMRVDRIKKSSIAEAERDVEKAEAELVELEKTTAIQMWLGELEEFLAVWDKHEAAMLKVMTASSDVGLTGKKKIAKRSGK
jgi:DNA topoisomerase-2